MLVLLTGAFRILALYVMEYNISLNKYNIINLNNTIKLNNVIKPNKIIQLI